MLKPIERLKEIRRLFENFETRPNSYNAALVLNEMIALLETGNHSNLSLEPSLEVELKKIRIRIKKFLDTGVYLL